MRQSLTRRREYLLAAMTDEAPDVCIYILDLRTCEFTPPPDIIDPLPSIAYPECHRMFKEAGTIKRHMIHICEGPYESEDSYRFLRDTWEGKSICAHCTHIFIDFFDFEIISRSAFVLDLTRLRIPSSRSSIDLTSRCI